MTAAAISNLPFAAGGAVAAAAGRAALWALAAYMRQPLRNTAVSGLVILSAMAGSNALYKQSHHHPAPLFGSFSEAPAVVKQTAVAPVLPAARPKKLDARSAPLSTASIDRVPEVASRPIGNADVIEIQRKLQAFGLFDGSVDGLFGPRTSRAIRAFETQTGRAPSGQLSQEIIDAIKATPITATPTRIETAPAPAKLVLEPVAEPAPRVTAKVEALPLASTEAEKPLPAPAPLLASKSTPVPTETVPTETDGATGSTGDAIDSLINGVQTMAITTPNKVVKRPVQTISVKAQTAAPAESQPMPAPLETAAADPVATAATDIVAAVQKGLSSLGFLHGEIDGVAGEATAKAIRNFEVYYNYDVTGRITPQLVKLLVQNGAQI